MRRRISLVCLILSFLVFAASGCEMPSPSPSSLPLVASPTSTVAIQTVAPPTPAATSALTLSPTPPPDEPPPGLTLLSTAFEPGGEMPLRHAQRTFDAPQGWTVTCPGENVSPPLRWSGVPEGTESLAVTLLDHICACERCRPLAPEGQVWGHWGIYNIPPTSAGLPEGMSSDAALADGARQVRNGYGEAGYGGPCPPPEHTHIYVFTLYALDTRLDLPEDAQVGDLARAVEGHVLEQVELVGTFRGR